MTNRERLKFRHRLMILGLMMIPTSSYVLLHGGTPNNHTLWLVAMVLAELSVMLLFMVICRCTNCRNSLMAVSRQVLLDPRFCNCPHCGISLDQSSQDHIGV